MVQEYIEIRGARENNLKDVSLRLPKRKITMFTGVSGSGKSSVVFATIANEAQRLLFENFSMFIRTLLPRYPQPDADAIENLSMAVIVDQKRLGGGSHSTVGTVTDIASVLRLLFSRIGKPYVGSANAFSFNDPQGMCLECHGLGRKIGVDPEALIDKTKSLNEGAVIAPGLAGWESDLYVRSGFFDNDKKIADYTTEELDLLLYSEPRKHTGLAYKFNRKFIARDIQTLSSRIRQQVEPFLKLDPVRSARVPGSIKQH
jgi:excinuclease UvrABC ATPase subunit